ncbi:G protein gamma domain-containing protein [Heracleum sosnowskyi]|uniref:G protein gamma domain-containing protein n=1 Tax=Heracleum sosnowskyi TaxID=360622 RepID=A0AAD8I5E8_9APIA|nr:G protein gamma domain-containing protein [Heracleum sosnowskyi]
MEGAKRETSTVPSLPPPLPKSPPPYPDLYGKRRELARVQMLEREIGFLEEELKTVGRIQPASHSCKEVADFVMANSDPLVTKSRKIRRSRRFWKWLCGKSCFNLSWIVQVAQLARVAQVAQLAQVAQHPAGHAAAGRAPAFNALKRAHAAIVVNAKVLLAQIARALALVHAASAAHAVVDQDVRRYHDALV